MKFNIKLFFLEKAHLFSSPFISMIKHSRNLVFIIANGFGIYKNYMLKSLVYNIFPYKLKLTTNIFKCTRFFKETTTMLN